MAGHSFRSLAPLVAAAVLAGGCFNSHNPSSFPYYLSGGPILQEHAKPLFGFFQDFDPKACRLDVTPHPQNATAPVGGPVVLVAAVVDSNGQPRRSRRVEWLVEGPGNIIEVDESGVYPGRGYKVDNKYAVGYTCYTSHTITRGNKDPNDDVTIGPGQTFCVVSSAVPGETTVTAYAPGVFNWDKGRVVTKVVWGEGRFKFPPAAIVRSGGECTLVTSVNHLEQDGPVFPPYRIRYRVMGDDGGPPVVLVSRTGTGTSGSQSGTDAKETETPVDTTGAAAVQLVQRNPRAGKTRVAIEIVKPSETGSGPGQVIGRQETVVEWAEPEVRLDVTAPPVAPPAAAIPVTVTLANAGQVDTTAAHVRVTLSTGARLESSDPPPNRQDGAVLVFELPPISARQKEVVTLRVLPPAGVGPVTVTAEVSTDDRLEARKDTTTRIEPGQLGILVESPPTARTGEQAAVRVAVTNSGSTPLANTTVWAQFDPGLAHPDGANPVELAGGTLAAGQTKVFDLPLSAKIAGRYAIRATATADGNVSASAAPVAIDVQHAELQVAVAGPSLVYLNQEFAWVVTVANTGDTALPNVVIRATLPPEVRLKDAGKGTPGAGWVEWRLPELKAGAKEAFTLTVESAKLTDRAATTVTATVSTGGTTAKPGNDPLQGQGQAAVAIIGTPAVVLELATPPGIVDVGKRVTYQIRVRNAGTVTAQNVEVTAYTPPQLKVVRATGKTQGQADPSGKVTFARLEELRPGETATFTVEVDAVQGGDARFRAEVQVEHLKNPLKEEQATRVVGGQ